VYLGLLILSLVAYGVQGALVGQVARRYDLLWVTALRGLALLLVMLPAAALLAPADAWGRLPPALPALALSCAAALAANLFATWAMRHLPMAIANAVCQSLSAVCTLTYEVHSTGTWPPTAALGWVAGIITSVGALAWLSSRGQPIAVNARPLVGLAACLGFGLCMAVALVPLMQVSRTVDPFIAGWAWEGGIGLIGLVILAARHVAIGPVPGLPRADALRLAVVCSPTLIGTNAYNYAVTLGSLAIAGGVLSAMMVIIALVAWIAFGERLRPSQWAAIAATALCLVGLGVALAG
jgi:drug/metabolite transporter (DMT)-like permease